jgi:hypothetical protein
MKQVLITIDTEVGELARGYDQGFEMFVEGKFGEDYWGVQKMVEILDAHSMRGEFFVDVYEKDDKLEKQFSSLCTWLVKHGHGVQLHTHPAGMFDAKRRYLKDYTAAEQDEIIGTGVERIVTWTGKKPTAHRAGGYGLGNEALPILARHGIMYDASYNRSSTVCELTSTTVNAPWSKNTIWEIPVTVFEQVIQKRLAGIVIGEQKRFQKLDFRYGADVAQIVSALDQMPDNAVVTVFLHSFNFLKLPYDTKHKRFGTIQPDYALVEAFEELLNILQKRTDCAVVGFDELRVPEKVTDMTPRVVRNFPWLRSLKNAVTYKLFGIEHV